MLVYCSLELAEDVFGAAIWSCTCLVFYLGRWATEKQERLHYLKILEEKRLRFMAEHSIDAPDSRRPVNGGSEIEFLSELPESFFQYSADKSSVQSAQTAQSA